MEEKLQNNVVAHFVLFRNDWYLKILKYFVINFGKIIDFVLIINGPKVEFKQQLLKQIAQTLSNYSFLQITSLRL